MSSSREEDTLRGRRRRGETYDLPEKDVPPSFSDRDVSISGPGSERNHGSIGYSTLQREGRLVESELPSGNEVESGVVRGSESGVGSRGEVRRESSESLGEDVLVRWPPASVGRER